MNEKLFVLTSQKKKTNHILHVIMTVLTGGLWLLVWGITMRSNDSHNKGIDKQINQIMHYKTQGRVIFVVLIVVFLYFYLR